MSDGFRSAEIGAPAFVRSSTCTAECNQWDGHAPPCAANSVVFVYGLKPQPASVFRSYRDLSAPPATCPHCGAAMGTTTT